MFNQTGDPVIRKYRVECCGTGDLSKAELAACIAIIQSGDAVHPDLAAAELTRAAVLAIARTEDKIVGVGAIKRVRTDYARRIGERSEAAFDPATPELGYVAVEGDHQGQRLSLRIVAELLSKHNGPLFATTGNGRMKKTLAKAEFVQKGQEWNGERGSLSLWTKD